MLSVAIGHGITRISSHTQGEKFIKFYESSPSEHKDFCSECGFPLGTLDTNPNVKPTRHVYVGSKAAWHDITDTLPQQKEFE